MSRILFQLSINFEKSCSTSIHSKQLTQYNFILTVENTFPTIYKILKIKKSHSTSIHSKRSQINLILFLQSRISIFFRTLFETLAINSKTIAITYRFISHHFIINLAGSARSVKNMVHTNVTICQSFLYTFSIYCLFSIYFRHKD